MELIKETLKSLSLVIIDPTLALILIILGIVFYLKNRNISAMQKMIAGESINSPLELTLSQICWGLIGGIIGSVALTLLGVAFDKSSGIQFIFIVSLLLMLIKPRFICFSYSGAILGFLSLVITLLYPESGIFRIDIVSLMTLVGVLHIVEGLLVIVDGGKGSIPVFTKKDGKILGGYAMNRYWIIPVALLIALNGADSSGVSKISSSTMSWWPVINSNKDIIKTSILVSIPFMGMISYSAVTFTRFKKEKTFNSGIGIVIYGIALTLISEIANFGLAGEIIVLVLAVVGHELMLKYQRKQEEKKNPLFYSREGKIKVLEVVPDSSADIAGIKVNDDIIKVNGEYALSEKDIYKFSRREYGSVNLEVKRENNNITIELKFQKERKLGLVLVPILVEDNVKIDVESKSFRDFLNKIKEKQIKLESEVKNKFKNGVNEKEVSEEENKKTSNEDKLLK